MIDKVEIRIGSKTISDYVSYEADADVLTPADVFTCRLGKLTKAEASVVEQGVEFELYVNGKREMLGVIDIISKSHSNSDLSMTVEGRDLGGLLVDCHVENWRTVHKKDLKAIATELIAPLPFIGQQRVVFGKGADKTAQAAFRMSHYRPGVTVAHVLSDLCQRKGLLWWIEPDGTLVFDKPVTKGKAAFNFYAYKDKANGPKNNILNITETNNRSKCYSKVIVTGQVQGDDEMEPGEHSVSGSATDSSFPFYKPLVMEVHPHEGSTKSQALHEIWKRRAEGYRITVTAARHSQNGQNYTFNRMAYVEDERSEIKGEFVVLARKLVFDGVEQKTILTLGLPLEGYGIS